MIGTPSLHPRRVWLRLRRDRARPDSSNSGAQPANRPATVRLEQVVREREVPGAQQAEVGVPSPRVGCGEDEVTAMVH